MKFLIPLMMIAISSFAHPAKAGIRENGGFLVPSAAELNFTSPGNGIDNELKDAVESLVESYQSAGLVRSYKKTGYGREGETKLCVQLSEIEASRRLNRELKELVDRSERKTNLEFISSCEKEQINGPFEMKSQVGINESPFSLLARSGLIRKAAYISADSFRSKSRQAKRNASANHELIECVGSGGTVVRTAPNDCPVGLGTFDDFKQRMEDRIREMERARR
jgi:hypothetical protein